MVIWGRIKTELWQGKQFFWSLFVFMLVFALLDANAFRDLLVFNQSRVLFDHEFWRLFSCQFVHWNRIHALGNLAVFAGLIVLINKTAIYRAVVLLIVLTLGLGVALLVIKSIELYAGFSATLYGLMVFTILTMQSVSSVTKWFVVFVIVLKLLLELFHLISTEATAGLIGASVATDMHLIAAVLSILFYFFSDRLMVSRKA